MTVSMEEMILLVAALLVSLIFNVIYMCVNEALKQERNHHEQSSDGWEAVAESYQREFIDYLKQRDLASPHPGDAEAGQG